MMNVISVVSRNDEAPSCPPSVHDFDQLSGIPTDTSEAVTTRRTRRDTKATMI